LGFAVWDAESGGEAVALRSLGEGGQADAMFYVYLIESLADGQRYVGITTDVERRLDAGKSVHTSKYGPWRLVTYIAFTNRTKAEAFERYHKSGSGHAFASKRLW
jgi:predicted GIY-YIG superfamily endonuclease